ncbi:MAG: carboxypeptidase-like regulatory domain-containing protein [Terriglobia bacterium]
MRGAAGFEYHGQVMSKGLPVPGATVGATQGDQHLETITDMQGLYSFPEISGGKWTVKVEMTGFASLQQDVVIGSDTPAGKWELKLLPLDEIKASKVFPNTATSPSVLTPEVARKKEGHPDPSSQPPAASAESADQEANQRAADGLLVNGSQLNGASTPFAQSFAFGNRRNSIRGLYNGGIGVIFDNSALDARPFSISGQSTPKPSYNRITGLATLGGPIRIPHLLYHGPNFFVAYQWTRDVNDSSQSALVPDAEERDGNLSQILNASGQPVEFINPATGQPVNMLSPQQISPQAQALLNYYPQPNFSGDPRFNYQVPINVSTHQDALQTRLNQTINPKNQVFGSFAFQSVRSATPNLFGFLDTTTSLGQNASLNWSHRLQPRLFMNLGYRLSRYATATKPFWENRANISAEAGIAGNNQDPANWGPPTLAFASGLAGLSDAQSLHNRAQTDAGSVAMLWTRFRHNISFGGDFRRQQFNDLYQQDPRGTFTFTGAATAGTANGAAISGYDFADFLLGFPDTSAVAFGNADKYFRESVYDAYLTDDWRVNPQLTINAGMRWDYGAPMTELYGRLVNLDLTPDFTASAPVLADHPVGPVTGETYPSSLIRPDRRGFEPRVAFAWRPFGGSSMVLRGGYGIYDDTSVYQSIVQQMAQQAPLSKSLSVQNSAACPLTLANGFIACPLITQNTYAIDPNFRVGYAQTWQLSIQRDLPGSMQLVATYLGIKGTRGLQEFLPNTYPLGAANPCPTCPVGFVYLASNGNSTRQSGQVRLRRRLHNGLTATVLYMYSKSIDDDSALGGQGALLPSQAFSSSSGGNGNGGEGQSGNGGSSASSVLGAPASSSPSIAQNWLNLHAERGLSPFDQRHLLNLQAQYTSGMGLGGRTLMSGKRGTFLKEWTFLTQISVGSGLPESPVYLATVPGTGITGSIRPEETGASIKNAPLGLFLNPAAFAAPPPGQWGNAGRNSIIGPSAFSLNAAIGRTFRLDRFNLDMRVDSTNFLNHVTYTTWDTTINSAQFGLPIAANSMRSMQASLRLRF